MPNYLGKGNRLKTPNDFQSVYRFNQVRARGQYFLVLAFFRFEKEITEKQSPVAARVGAVVSKKVSKLAVRRNTIKRLVKESFRLQTSLVSNFDFIVIANPNAKTQPNTVLKSELDNLWYRINKRCNAYLLD